MTLRTETVTRVPDQRLIQLTNRNNRNATTVLDATMDAAVDDAEAYFPIYAGVNYDNTNAGHIAVGVFGVVAFLINRSGLPAQSEDPKLTTFKEELANLAKIGARDRILPQTKSLLDPSQETDEAGNKPRPDFDRELLGPWLLDQPGGRVQNFRHRHR